MPSVKLWVDAAKSVALMVGFKKKKNVLTLQSYSMWWYSLFQCKDFSAEREWAEMVSSVDGLNLWNRADFKRRGGDIKPLDFLYWMFKMYG